MVIFEEVGLKQSFKIILNTKGIIIRTKGILSDKYKETYSKLYQEINDVFLEDKFFQTKFIIDHITLNFDSNNNANIISNLIALGKTNTERLIYYIGEDGLERDIEGIDLDELMDDVSANRFNRANPAKSMPIKGDTASEVEMSATATLNHIIDMRMKAMGLDQQQSANAHQVAQPAPPRPPVIGVSCFSYYAYIEGKQQGPYDEKQFGALVDYGLIKDNTPVWKEGMHQWQNASAVPETMKFFMNNTPPPPPVCE